MDTLRMVGVIAVAIIIAIVALKVLTIALTIFMSLVTLLFFAGVLFVCFLVARSALGKRNDKTVTR